MCMCVSICINTHTYTYMLCICRFTYLLKFICTSKSMLVIWSQSFENIHRAAKNSRYPTHMFPDEVQQGATLSSCFSSHIVNIVLIVYCLFSAMHFVCLCFLLVIFLFKMPFKCSAKMLSRVPKSKKAVMRLTEKVCVFNMLLSGMSYCEPTIFIK